MSKYLILYRVIATYQDILNTGYSSREACHVRTAFNVTNATHQQNRRLIAAPPHPLPAPPLSGRIAFVEVVFYLLLLTLCKEIILASLIL